MLAEGRTGLISAADGSVNPVRLDRTGATTVVSAHPLYSEAVLRGNMFCCSTAVAGVAPGTALSTTPPITLLNPFNSGVQLVILKTSLGYISGTLGAGAVVYAYVTPQATIPTGGTELTSICTMIGQVHGKGRVFQGSTLTGTPLILRSAYNMGAGLATSVDFIRTCQDLLEGEFVVPEGTCFVMQGVAAAGTTPLVLMGLVWEEMLYI
jgi:hypothetical protein